MNELNTSTKFSMQGAVAYGRIFFRKCLFTSLLLLNTAWVRSQEFRPIFNPPLISLTEALANDPQNFQTLVGLLKQANLKELQSAEASFTLLAPTDEAFAKLPTGYLDRVAKDPKALQRLLKAHLIPGKVVFKQVFNSNGAPQTGQKITKTFYDVNKKRGSVQCNAHPAHLEKEHHPLVNGKARVLKSDVEGTYAVIHVIDTVLVPDK